MNKARCIPGRDGEDGKAAPAGNDGELGRHGVRGARGRDAIDGRTRYRVVDAAGEVVCEGRDRCVRALCAPLLWRSQHCCARGQV